MYYTTAVVYVQHARGIMVDVVCVGCGKDLTHEPKNRCNPQAERCADAIKVWRRLFMKVEDETMATSRVKDETMATSRVKDETMATSRVKDETMAASRVEDETMAASRVEETCSKEIFHIQLGAQ